jgi:hypothetical protein
MRPGSRAPAGSNPPNLEWLIVPGHHFQAFVETGQKGVEDLRGYIPVAAQNRHVGEGRADVQVR